MMKGSRIGCHHDFRVLSISLAWLLAFKEMNHHSLIWPEIIDRVVKALEALFPLKVFTQQFRSRHPSDPINFYWFWIIKTFLGVNHRVLPPPMAGGTVSADVFSPETAAMKIYADHEIRDCLIAKHQARETKGRELDSKDQAEIKRPTDHQPLQRSESDIYHFSAANPNGDDHDHGHRRERSYDYREHKYDARRNLEERRRYRSSQDTVSRRYSRHASKERQRSFDSRYSHHKDPNPPEREVTSRAQREHHGHRETSFSSPPRRGRSETRRDEPVVVNENRAELGRNYPIREQQAPNPQEVLNEARAEVRETMLQYTQCADPTESAARRERMRIAEEKGQLEKSAIRIAQANLGGNDTIEEEPVRIVEKSASRTPAVLRLAPPNLPLPLEDPPAITEKRKPGRPPGKRKVRQSPKNIKGSSSKKRRCNQLSHPLPEES
ncbi:hypothetical protein F2Q70_00033682 [Brassica cretica]|uniref:Uncharacterized protein n=1 Tax=Brassica cretica TaxID=69181 RepID=A0A8S9JPH1_BRACR|nr:hypothetical protein F2Q70_00033682 [Brassica cretica]